jgi:acetyl esterase
MSATVAETGLDPQARALLERLAEQPFPDITTLPPEEMRAAHAAFFHSVGLAPDPALADARDHAVPTAEHEIPVRVYTPHPRTDGPLPLVVYLHGGGMVAGSIDSYDAVCRLLAHRSGAVVASVGYRLAPEHRFPAAVEDAWAALEWAMVHAWELGADSGRVAIAGDSAGGNLAAVTAQQARDRGVALALQVLVYPAVGTLGHSRSMGRFATGYLFERGEYDWLFDQYLDDPAQARDPRVSPILAADLSGLAPALVVTAGFDIMRDDAEAYAERLRDAGVPVSVRRFGGTIHAFMSMAGVLDAGREAIEECAAALRAAFADPDHEERA